MPGILFFADLFGDWIYQLSVFWDHLNVSFYDTIFHDIGDGPFSSILIQHLKDLFADYGLDDLTLFGVIVASLGTWFAAYALIVFLKFVFGLFT